MDGSVVRRSGGLLGNWTWTAGGRQVTGNTNGAAPLCCMTGIGGAENETNQQAILDRDADVRRIGDSGGANHVGIEYQAPPR